jgi:hypothetical protein
VLMGWAREASNPRPYGCELTRRLPLPQTLWLGYLGNHRDNQRLIAVRSAGSAMEVANGLAQQQSHRPTYRPLRPEEGIFTLSPDLSHSC